MHSRIYGLKADGKEYVSTDQNELFDFLDKEKVGIDYVEELPETDFFDEVKELLNYLNNMQSGSKVLSLSNYIVIPTDLLKKYVEKCIEDLKTRVNKISLKTEIYYGGKDYFRAFSLGDPFDILFIDEDGLPCTFYSWACEQLYWHANEKNITYEIVQIFDTHY